MYDSNNVVYTESQVVWVICYRFRQYDFLSVTLTAPTLLRKSAFRLTIERKIDKIKFQVKSIHELAHGSPQWLQSQQQLKLVRFTHFFPDVKSIEWSKCYPLSISFAGVITAAVLSSMGALAAILIAAWFIKYKKRAIGIDDRGRNGESMNDSNMSRKMHRFQ